MNNTTVSPTMQAPNSLDNRFYELIGHLWRGGKYGYFWTPNDGEGGKYTHWLTLPFAEQGLPKVFSGTDVYFGVNPSIIRRSQHERARNTDITVVNGFFCEFDCSTPDAKLAAAAKIQAWQIPASCVIDSGGGYHVYILLKNPLTIDTPEKRKWVQDLQWAFAQWAGGDTSVNDLARVLRVPGTTNHKPKYAPDYPIVTIVEFDLTRQYELAQLEPLLQPIIDQRATNKAHTPSQPTQSGTVSLSDQDVLNKMFAIQKNGNGAMYERLWNGDLSDVNGDHNRADQKLCNGLAWATVRDASRIDSLFRKSKLMRPKWDERRGSGTYGSQTIDKAVSSAQQSYDPNYAPSDDSGVVDWAEENMRQQANAAQANQANGATGNTTTNQTSGAATGSVGGSQSTVNGGAGATNAAGQQSRSGKQKQSDTLYELARRNVSVFHSQDGESYGFVMVNNHRECYKLRSSIFRSYLGRLFWLHSGSTAGGQAVEDALRILEFDATQLRQDVFVRVGNFGDTIYIDLCNEDWNAIEITAAGWKIVDAPPIAFRRTKGMERLPIPVPGGNVQSLRKYLTADQSEFYLVVAWLMSAMRAKGPYPVLTLTGEQGAAKSTNLRVLKQLVDPSKPLLRSQPKEIRDLMIAASRNWLLAFDNISHISSEISDIMCQIATGGGYATRSNYTDDEEVLFDVMRPLAINGITDIVQRPDLMDRSIVIQLPAIPESKRKEENIFWQEFGIEHPQLLGAILDLLSSALANLPTIKLDSLPRMADFAKLGAAAEKAMGLSEGDFMRLYRENRKEGASAILENSPLAEPIEKLMAIQLTGIWEGQPQDLLGELNKHASDSQRASKEWPKGPNALTTTLKRLAPNFRQRGIDLHHGKSNGSRRWVVRYI